MTLLHHLLLPSLERPAAALESIGGSKLNGTQLRERAAIVANALAGERIAKDEPILLKIGNEPEDVAGYLGIWEAGAVAVPYHKTSPEIAVAALRDRVRCRFAIDAVSLKAIGGAEPPLRPELSGAAIIVFTSGSTGKPKGVIVGHEALTYKLGVLSELLPLGAEDAVLCPLQLTFIFGVWVTLLGLLAGSRTVLMPKFSTDSAASFLDHATILAAVPSMLRSLAQKPPRSSPRIKAIFTGGEPLGVALAERLGTSFPGVEIFDLYGLTETGSCDFCLAPKQQPAGLGTIGKPTEGVEFQIAPVGGHYVPNEGELQIRTPSRMIGYLDDAESTARAFASGFFKTGDLARVREDGFVELIGRLKEIISRGGNKIAPLEVDGVFAQHPDVQAAITTGVPDPALGETIHVLIVRRHGSDVNAASLREWAAARLERFKVPDAIHFVETLPSGATGKADRQAAAQMIKGREPLKN
jgi:long-chain acyl-CoA synthetase